MNKLEWLKKSKTRNTLNGAGYTIHGAALELKISDKVLENGIACGDVKVISFAGARRITRAEMARLKKLFEQTTEE